MKKGITIFFIVITSLLIILLFGVMIYADYKWNKEYNSYWSLSDKTSTLEAKEGYITQFVDKIENNRNQFAEYNAIILKVPDNNCDNNINAVKTLRDRLRSIKNMNESSFEYQTAMQQITGQEQGEAQVMMNELSGCYILKNYPLAWSWICGILIGFLIILINGEIIILIYLHEKDKEETRRFR